MPCRQILLTSLNEEPKVEEYEMTKTESELFFTRTKTGICSYYGERKWY